MAGPVRRDLEHFPAPLNLDHARGVPSLMRIADYKKEDLPEPAGLPVAGPVEGCMGPVSAEPMEVGKPRERSGQMTIA